MKKCPVCNQLFTDDNSFCLNDGTTLETYLENPPRSFQTPADMPTQVFRQPSNTISETAVGTSKWLFLIIGVLATALAAMAIFMFVQWGKTENAKTDAENSKVAKEPGTTEPATPDKMTETGRPDSAAANKAPTPDRPRMNPNLTPTGNWSGDWNSKSTYFTATANFTETDGRVSGQINWTIRRTTNPKKIDKIGSTATEYVQGSFDPATRRMTLKGVRKDDPANIIILDSYNLVLAENNQTLNGRSPAGVFTLNR